MKKFWAVIIILAVVIVGYLFLVARHRSIAIPLAQNGTAVENNSNSPVARNRPQTTPSTAATASAPTAAAPNALAAIAASPNVVAASGSETNPLADLPPLTALDKARVVIRNYCAAIGENPVGTNPEITAALKGKNPKQTDFLGDSGLRVNENGELVDGYGTPFFFHQISGKEMEIRSAGQDHVLWTADDLVTR